MNALNELLATEQVPVEAIAYLGDDLPDLPVIRRAGLAVPWRMRTLSFDSMPMPSPPIQVGAVPPESSVISFWMHRASWMHCCLSTCKVALWMTGNRCKIPGTIRRHDLPGNNLSSINLSDTNLESDPLDA